MGAVPKPGTAPPEFREVYEAWFDYVWRTLRRLGVREADLADATQEAFVVVHRRLPSFEVELPVGPWIAGIAFRVAAQERRRARHRRERLTDFACDSTAGGGATPEEAAMTAQRARRVLAALDTLDLDRRVVFVLHEMDGTSCPDIARALEVPTNTVYSRLRVARERFKAAIDRLRLRDGEA